MITLQHAKKALEAAEKKALELQVAISIAIVDTHGSIIASQRMDNAIPISPKFAYSKAFTSASLGMPSEALAAYATEGKPYYGINTLFGGELTTMAGGLPIKMNNMISGGIGVGGSPDTSMDVQCANAALEALMG